MYHTFRILLLPKGPCWNETSVFFGNKCGNIPLCTKNMSRFTPKELPLQSHLQATCDCLAVNEGVQVVCGARLAEHGAACFKVEYTSNPLSLIFCVFYATFAFDIYMCFKKLVYKLHFTQWMYVNSSISYSAITSLQGFEALLHRLVLKNSGFLGWKKIYIKVCQSYNILQNVNTNVGEILGGIDS